MVDTPKSANPCSLIVNNTSMELIFEQIRTGGDRNFGYLLGDRSTKQAVLIDPSYSPDTLVDRATSQHLVVAHIINTHGHPDHTEGNDEAARLTGAKIAAHPDGPIEPDISLSDGQTIPIGILQLQCLHVPGHASDHLVLYEPSYQLLFTGDLIFVGKVGGTATEEDATIEWTSLQRVLSSFPNSSTIWPGHDYGVRPTSTLGLERRSNPFLLCDNLEAFLHLKHEWPTFKQTHGLK